MSVAIAIDKQKIAEFCRKWRITEFSLFGSVLRDDFGPDSDVDVLVSFEPRVRIGLHELYEIEQDLERLFGRKADFVERKAVEQSPNWIRRRHILENLEPIYVAG
jgi:hypothetical protein